MSLKWYTYLFSYYAKSRLFNIKRPVLAGVKITNACNLKCRHCPFWRMEEKSLSFSQVKESFKNLYDIGIRLVIIEGGEPFLWKDDGYDIRNIVKEAREFFFSVGITTNGTFPLEVDSDIIWQIDEIVSIKDKKLQEKKIGKLRNQFNQLSNSTICRKEELRWPVRLVRFNLPKVVREALIKN